MRAALDPRLAMIAPLVLALSVMACSPTVKVETPTEPITINLNINLSAEVVLKLEEAAQDDIAQNPNVF